MSPEGMVHALDEIHRLLKPDGILIDIHPFAEAYMLEVHRDRKCIFSKPRPNYTTEGFSQADDALAKAAQQHRFAIESMDQFDYRVYGKSVDELFAYHAEIDAYDETSVEELQAKRQEEIYIRLESIMQDAGEGAEVASHDHVHITRLRPIR